MTHYTVISPECSEVVPILDYGEGPIEYFHCVATVAAENASKAKALALKHKEFAPWRKDIGWNENPFVGLQVQTNICPHGLCQCELCCDGGEPTCPLCLELFEKEWQELFEKELVEQMKAKEAGIK